MVDLNDFEKAESGASMSIPIQISDVKKGVHILMGENRPCKVMEITTSKTGKHGHAKANITGVDIFNGRKYQDVSPVSHAKECPEVKRTEWIVMSIDEEGFVSMVNKLGKQKEDLKLPNDIPEDEETCKRIKEGLEAGKTMMVTVLESMGLEKIEETKESNE
jgi:translation initiation factor 5A